MTPNVLKRHTFLIEQQMAPSNAVAFYRPGPDPIVAWGMPVLARFEAHLLLDTQFGWVRWVSA
jgi:hypothetical protein